MSKPDLYRQAELRRGNVVDVSWIPSSMARVGATLTVGFAGGESRTWTVTKVYDVTATREQLDGLWGEQRDFASVLH